MTETLNDASARMKPARRCFGPDWPARPRGGIAARDFRASPPARAV